uniref:Glycine cleavage system H protein n=1 Tax=Rhabditophanes sp. KR3021 TaxID=114890 RepID=A0AC35TRN7_9BILA
MFARSFLKLATNATKLNNFSYSIHVATRFASSGRLYTKKHEWVTVDGKIGTVGVSDFAQEALGDVVYVEVPEVGATIEKGNVVGIIESVKAASDVYSPISGQIKEVNEALFESPNIINKSPYSEGWLYKIELASEDELKDLMDETTYEKYKTEEAH